MDKCINHYYDKVIKYCTLYEVDYYYINNNKRICSYISPDVIDTYYKIDSGPNPCREKCYKKFKYSNKCIDTRKKCTECVDITILFDNIDPHLIHRGSCLIKLQKIIDNISTIDLDDFPNKFAPNLKNANIIDNYINRDYTVTVFLYSECTEDLINQGYFKIDSSDLQYKIVNQFNSNENLTYSVFITLIFKSHFRYYNHELEYINTTTKIDIVKY